MDKPCELREIKRILRDMAWIWGVDEDPETEKFIEKVCDNLSKCPHPNFEEIKTRLRKKVESKVRQESINNLIQENES